MRQTLCEFLAVTLGVACLAPSWVGAQQRDFHEVPRSDFWQTNGPIREIDIEGDIAVIGGDFSYVGPSTGHAGLLDLSTGLTDPTFPRVMGNVYAQEPDGEGGWYLGGSALSISDETIGTLMHLMPDGTVAPELGSPSGGLAYVSTIVLSGESLYVGGRFTQVGGTTRNNLAAFNTVTGELLNWNPNASSDVQILEVFGDTVLVGGAFNTIGGETRSRLAALDRITGQATSWDPNAKRTVYAIEVVGDQIYVGGQSGTLSGQARTGVGRYDGVTGELTDWAPETNGWVNAIAVSGDTVYLGGVFTALGGQPRGNIGAVDTTTGATMDWRADVVGTVNQTYVKTIELVNASVCVGGDFNRVGGETSLCFARLDPITGDLMDESVSADDDVITMGQWDDKLLVGGWFQSVGGVPRGNIASIDLNTGRATDWAPRTDEYVTALVASGSTAYLSGAFTQVNGVARYRFAAVDMISNEVLPWLPSSVTAMSYAMTHSDSRIFLASNFHGSNGPQVTLAALDPITAGLRDWDYDALNEQSLTLPYPPYSMLLDGDTLYVGYSGLRAINVSSGEWLSWEVDLNIVDPQKVHGIALSGDVIYVGGDFDRIDGQFRNNLAAVNASTGAVLDWDAHLEYDQYIGVSSLVVEGNTLLVGGHITTVSGEVRHNLAALNAETGEPLDWAPLLDSAVHCIAKTDHGLLVGGDFYNIPKTCLALYEEILDTGLMLLGE